MTVRRATLRANVSVRRPSLFMLLSWLGLRSLRRRLCTTVRVDSVPIDSPSA